MLEVWPKNSPATSATQRKTPATPPPPGHIFIWALRPGFKRLLGGCGAFTFSSAQMECELSCFHLLASSQHRRVVTRPVYIWACHACVDPSEAYVRHRLHDNFDFRNLSFYINGTLDDFCQTNHHCDPNRPLRFQLYNPWLMWTSWLQGVRDQTVSYPLTRFQSRRCYCSSCARKFQEV